MLVRRLTLPLALAAAMSPRAASAEGVAGPTVAAHYEPIGYAVYPIPTAGFAAAYYLTPELAVEASYAKGGKKQLLATDFATLGLARLRYYLGSLTQVNVGVGSRQLGTRYSVRTVSGEDKEITTEITAMVGEISLGSHIEFGPVRLACDLIGITVPLKKTASKNGFPDDADPAELDANDKDFNKVAMVPTLEFVRLGVGVVF